MMLPNNAHYSSIDLEDDLLEKENVQQWLQECNNWYQFTRGGSFDFHLISIDFQLITCTIDIIGIKNFENNVNMLK
jgi:hypothetical protein